MTLPGFGSHAIQVVEGLLFQLGRVEFGAAIVDRMATACSNLTPPEKWPSEARRACRSTHGYACGIPRPAEVTPVLSTKLLRLSNSRLGSVGFIACGLLRIA